MPLSSQPHQLWILETHGLSVVAEGLLSINRPSGVCRVCVMSKHHWESFLKDYSRWASKSLELIYSNICVPMTTCQVGANYFLTFVDYFYCFLWVYTIKSNDEVFAKSWECKNLVENQCRQ